MSNARTVETYSAVQQQAVNVAALPRTLMGGTRAMRAAGATCLPREEGESVTAYDKRLARTTLFNAFGKTVGDMTGKVFAKPVVLKDDVPEALKKLAEDIDLTGRHINVFARDVFYDAMQTGIGFILVDMPPAVVHPDGRPPTLADEAEAGIRPYLLYIPMERLRGWKSTIIDGAETLTQIRIFETVTEPDGDYHETTVDQVRVVEPGRWEIFRKSDKGDWVSHARGTYSLRKITLVPVYTERTGFMTGRPPLERLAELNVSHWQSQSDQRNILHVARVPILFGSGIEDTAVLEIGAGRMIRCSSPEAKLAFVEHSGKAIEAGDRDLQNIETQMQAMGLQLLVSAPSKTATGEVRENSKENSPLAMMARSLGDALEQALGYMAEFLRLGEDGGEVEVNTDFGIQAGAGADLQQLLDAANAGRISNETFWAEWLRRGVLSDSFDPDAETERLDTAAEKVAAMDDDKEPLDLNGDD